jgi:UDP-glucose 4-epimerase
MRVVVTGSNGFIGHALVKQLMLQQHEVCVLVRNKTADADPYLHRISYSNSLLECGDELQKWKPDVFFHLAWRGVNNTNRNNEENNQYNYRLTLDAVELASETGSKQWIGAGSQAEYGAANKLLSESDECKPITDYGITKQQLCNETEMLCKKYNMVFTWARLFSVYGPNDHSTTFISYLINTMLHQQIPQVSSCTQQWDYLFIKDAATALVSLIGHEGVYNIASGKTVLLKEVVEAIAQFTGYHGEVSRGAKPDGVLYYLCGSIEKISSRTGWAPTVSLPEGLAETTLNYHSAI